MKKILLTVLAAAAVAGAGAAPAAAQELPKSPAKACAALATLDPETYAFIATKPGGCQSSIAKEGYAALASFMAFPSTAAAIGNCKTLERTLQSEGGFLATEGADPYPYAFYKSLRDFLEMIGEDEAVAYYDANASQFLAKNRAGCVQVLKRVHAGLANPLFAALPGPPA